ncbi:ADP-dependent (S)-NAD(P)H-hydrate dehydratase [Candidatus Kuenenia stuttgartiensis]|jgi:NAD(P)H-hydrate epimerase|uniref:ADP-dependent (S)-NAD(P)H-hydrate dehydratase n=2 Tax=Kuenenia stuttgartiensis TaxID=174633 RepID=A0A2C9CIN1_KUEST|nr:MULTISPECIES: NAD(P)H-hydrate dehydratase [Kuenenia]MBE7547950.1 NAD(P)H-hydrate dehydratase [Planctomycetia bacterium]MBW7943331.1 NAD(P)H-hydrate dehydratase [Candidatus Kuenenia stuttgartiensis]MBZ0192933.1 NAD(P)H-hydrate dehydratase [Candidatus Kuenenia stuttgartiensis]MCF6151875.1 NAD(P)H-hydrate dehydratase [Candidatus Kuenenia stuttgartiensis]MCL4727245.1 NAD(P)H-hydrate dehydratase [Candidatus Kuenenia stuttgartiensis]
MMQQINSILKIPPRKPDSHKGDFGRVLVIAGSYGMTGAACLCSEAALRSGAGLVTLGIPESLHGIVATKLTCVMTHPLPETHLKTLSDMGRQDILDFSQRFDVVAIGPGLSQCVETKRLVLWLLQNIERPIVLDADGINALAEDTATLDKIKQHVILTPHPQEMARLLKVYTTKEIQSKRKEIAEKFINSRDKVTLVLKGNNTIVMNNEKYYVNTTGNPGMATAGSGDILTGMIAALLGQNFPPFEAAQLGVYLHGTAGDYAKQAVGEISMTATDILDNLPKAFLNHIQNK